MAIIANTKSRGADGIDGDCAAGESRSQEKGSATPAGSEVVAYYMI